MEDLGVIGQFVATVSACIDSGFGLLQPDIAFLKSALIAIDIKLGSRSVYDKVLDVDACLSARQFQSTSEEQNSISTAFWAGKAGWRLLNGRGSVRLPKPHRRQRSH